MIHLWWGASTGSAGVCLMEEQRIVLSASARKVRTYATGTHPCERLCTSNNTTIEICGAEHKIPRILDNNSYSTSDFSNGIAWYSKHSKLKIIRAFCSHSIELDGSNNKLFILQPVVPGLSSVLSFRHGILRGHAVIWLGRNATIVNDTLHIVILVHFFPC
jgi:hypothetical protein